MAKQINYPTADENEVFYRRVLKGDRFIDKKSKLPTSRAFALREQDNGELSVDAASLTTPQTSIVNPEKFKLFEVSHPDVKDCGVSGYLCPIDGNQAHSAIIGENFTIEDDVTPGLLARKAKNVVL